MRFALQARFLLFREASVIILVCGFKGIMYKMKFAKLQFTTLLSALAIASALLGLGGCGGGGGAPEQATTTTTLPPSTIIPVSGANSPLIGVTMTVTCANGRTGSGSVGTPSNPGEGSITVNGSCTAPILISATGSGKMRPIGAKDDGSEDVPYDPAINLPVGNVVAAFPNTAVPVNPVTALVAGQVSPATLANETASSLASKKASVASALGLPAASLDKDYRDAALAKAATLIVEVAALAVTNAATTGALPNAVTGGGTTLGAYVLEKIASQAASAGSGTLSNAATLAAALKQADPKLDATKSVAELGKIDLDAGRVNNLIATYAAGATSAADALSKIAVAAISASDANSPTPAQKALVADVTARIQEAAKEQVRNSVSKMVMNVAVAANSTTSNSVAVAQAAANNLLDAQFTAMAQAGARPADLAAKAMAVADSVTEALKTDLSAATKIFDTPPLVGNANAAAALVGQAMVAAADVTAASSPPSAANTAVAATNALRVATAIKDIVPPKPAASSISQAAYQAAFQAAVEAVADRAFNLHGIQATTNPVGPLIIINGPIRNAAGVNCGRNALGPGCRANATIGRALRLCLINIGGGIPGETDKAILGMPGKYTFCLGEYEEESPWEPLHVSRGLKKEDSAVTIVSAQGTNNVVILSGNAEDALMLTADAMMTMGNNNVVSGNGNPVVFFSPGHARLLYDQGFKTRRSVQAFLFEHARIPVERFPKREILPSKPMSIRTVIDGKVCAIHEPDDLLVVVAGGPEPYHITYCASIGNSIAPTRRIRTS